MEKEIFSAISGIIMVVAYIPYIIALARKKTCPAKASWIIWAILDTITFAGMYTEGTLNGQIIGVVIGVWIVALLALKNGKPGWSNLDKFCLGGSALGITFWGIFHNAIFGIVISCSIIFIGSIPTFISAWEDSKRENKLAWTLSWISCFFALPAIPAWTLSGAAQPLVFLMVNNIMMWILFIHRA